MEDELTVAEAADLIGVVPSRVQQLCRAYQRNHATGLPCRVIGAELGPRRASYRIMRADALAYKARGTKRGWPAGKERGPRPKKSATPTEGGV